MKQFKLVDRFSGYSNKRDATNTGSTFLIDGSKNVFINDGEKVSIRPGFSLFGAENETIGGITSSHVMLTSAGPEIPMRSYDDELEFYYDGEWRRLADSWASTDFVYTDETWWDNTEKVGLTIFVNGDSNLYAWNGAIAVVDSSTSTTITKTGSETWAELGFFGSSNLTLVNPRNGNEYTYTGGTSTTTLTGVNNNTDLLDGDVLVQKIVTTSNQPGGASFTNNIVAILKNQIYVASDTQHLVFVSKAVDYANFSASTPREVGEGETLTLEGPIRAIYVQEESVYISAGNDLWYQTVFTPSADLLSENLTIDRLKTGPQQAAWSHSATGKIKNDILFVSREPSLDTLGRVLDTEKPQSIPISDPIKSFFKDLDFTIDPSMIYYQNKTYISFPSSSVVLVYDWEHRFWNPPWTMSISSFSIIDNELYGHSAVVNESYKLLDGKNDNGQPIEAIAKFAYKNYGVRHQNKEFDEYYVEGYIGGNTKLELNVFYDYEGANGFNSSTIDATDQDILFKPSTDASIGKSSLGKEPLGSSGLDLADKTKFRVIKEFSKQDFYEHATEFYSNEVDAEWELLAQGPNATFSKADNVSIKQ